ncbi:hypothetical protein HPGCJGGD_2574 [Methylobacterium haplocladii]|nr:hypothetical protein HPGCJGGD_2574 [Methylobacterium haplocladii]
MKRGVAVVPVAPLFASLVVAGSFDLIASVVLTVRIGSMPSALAKSTATRWPSVISTGWPAFALKSDLICGCLPDRPPSLAA